MNHQNGSSHLQSLGARPKLAYKATGGGIHSNSVKNPESRRNEKDILERMEDLCSHLGGGQDKKAAPKEAMMTKHDAGDVVDGNSGRDLLSILNKKVAPPPPSTRPLAPPPGMTMLGNVNPTANFALNAHSSAAAATPPNCTFPIPDILKRGADHQMNLVPPQHPHPSVLSMVPHQQPAQNLQRLIFPNSSRELPQPQPQLLPSLHHSFGRGHPTPAQSIRAPLRRPGRTAYQTLSRSFFCHACKRDLPYVDPGLICPFCHGDFIEESCSVDQQVREVEQEQGQHEHREERPSTTGKAEEEDESGFAWVPPSHLYQAFLSEENKLVALEHANPYLYLDEEDEVDSNFPDLPSSPVGYTRDERIAAKELAIRQRNKARLISATTTVSGSLDCEDYWEDDDDDEMWSSDDGAGGDDGGDAKPKLTRAQRKRQRRRARRLLLQAKKQEEREAMEKAEAERQRLSQELQMRKNRQRMEKESRRHQLEMESKLIKLEIAKSIQG